MPIQTLIIPPSLLLRKMIMSQLELGPPMVHWALSRKTRVLVLVRAKCCALETCGEKM